MNITKLDEARIEFLDALDLNYDFHRMEQSVDLKKAIGNHRKYTKDLRTLRRTRLRAVTVEMPEVPWMIDRNGEWYMFAMNLPIGFFHEASEEYPEDWHKVKETATEIRLGAIPYPMKAVEMVTPDRLIKVFNDPYMVYAAHNAGLNAVSVWLSPSSRRPGEKYEPMWRTPRFGTGVWDRYIKLREAGMLNFMNDNSRLDIEANPLLEDFMKEMIELEKNDE